MASPNGKSMTENTPDHRSGGGSIGSPTTKRSHRSRSRSRDKRDRHRDSKRDRDDHRSHERSHRDRRSRSRERSHRDREKERSDRDKDRGDRDKDRSERDKERGERDKDRGDRDRERSERDKDRGERHRDRENGESRHRDRDRDRDADERRDSRRRRRPDEPEDNADAKEKEDRAKRRREDDAPGSTDGKHASDRRERSRDSDRRRRDDRDRDRDRYHDRDRRDRDDRDRGRRDMDVDQDRRSDRDPGGRPGGRLEDRPPPPPPPPAPTEDKDKAPPPNARRVSPTYEEEEPDGDSEARSVFVSQLAARLTARDLGYFFEDKLGVGAVRDARIVTDRLSRRSKGIGYVELKNLDFVSKALDLSGTIVMGLPIMVQLTEAERNRIHAGDGTLNLPPGVTAPRYGGMQLYVGSLHFSLTEADIRQVFEPFGDLEFVDLHKDPATGRSKGYAFVQYKRPDDAKMALDAMDGFELAGRTLRVNTVHDKGAGGAGALTVNSRVLDSLEDAGGGNLNAASRQALMQKLARIDPPVKAQNITRPNIPQAAMTSRSVLLRHMFNAEEETEANWDKELAEEVKTECEGKYGKVEAIKVEKDSQGEIYIKFDTVESAKAAVDSLNGRWFGGNQIAAACISDAIMQAHQ